MVNGKNKGASGEREAAQLLAGIAEEIGYFIDPSRNLEQVRGGGYDLNGVPGLGVEVKRQENLQLKAWWDQATRQAEEDGTIPLLMWRQNKKKWNFKVRVTVAVYNPDKTDGKLLYLDVEMNLEEFTKWFHLYLEQNDELIE